MGIKIGNPFKNSGSFTKAVGSFIPGIGDADAQADANEINIDEAEKNRRFQAEMSNTAYQRGMADMKKAGLNPILAYMQGPASQPTGSQATVQPESRTKLANMALQAYTGVSNTATAKQAVDQQATMNESSIKLNAANAAKSLQEAEKLKINNEKERKYAPIHKAAGDLADMAEKTVRQFFTNSGKAVKELKVTPLYKDNPNYQKMMQKHIPSLKKD